MFRRTALRALVLLATVAFLTSPAAIVLSDHYGFTPTYYNTYIIGWNTENGYNAGQTSGLCGDDHWRHFSRENIYGYSAYANPYVNWVELYDGSTIGSNAWVYGVTWVVGDNSIFIDSWQQSFYSDTYYYVFSTISTSNGNFAVQTWKGEYPDGNCGNVGYQALHRA